MKEFNELLKYRQYYEYDYDCEAIKVLGGEFHNEATELYSHFVKDYFMTDKEKWPFDIALDCIKNFTDEECSTIKSQEEIFDYHFGYGMYVRNKYIHPSKFHSYYMADNISSRVAAYIYTILLPIYNCLSEEFMELVADFDYDSIKKQYGSTQPIIMEMAERLANFEKDLTAKGAIKKISETIRTNLGTEEFKNILYPIAKEHISKHKYINIEWNELINKLYNKTRIYQKEYNQFKAIKEMNIISSVSGSFPSIKTIEEASDYIMKNIGFSCEDSIYMAECAFEIGRMQDKQNKQ